MGRRPQEKRVAKRAKGMKEGPKKRARKKREGTGQRKEERFSKQADV